MAVAFEKAAEMVSKLSVAAIAPSKNALKRELRKKQKEDDKRLKKGENSKKVSATRNFQSNTDPSIDEDDIAPTQYYENKLNYLVSQKISGLNPYPHKFPVSISVKIYIQKYASLNKGERLKENDDSLRGRIMNKRTSSSKLHFYDLYCDGAKVQVMADASFDVKNSVSGFGNPD